MQAEMLILRVVHVLGGIFWVGSALFMAFMLMPALASAGPAAGAVMGAMQRRRLFRKAYAGSTLREHYGLDWPSSDFPPPVPREAALQRA